MYAAEARSAGRTGDMLGASPADALRAIDARTFADLPDDIPSVSPPPPPRIEDPTLPESAFARGADSAEAEAVDAQAIEDLREKITTGPFGPILRVEPGDWRGAIEALKAREVPGALAHPKAKKISLVGGSEGGGPRTGAGISKILKRRPEVLDDLQGRLSAAQTVISESSNRLRLTSDRDIFVISKDVFGAQHNG